MMWLVFERLFPRSAADEMVRIFARNVRSMSDLLLFAPRPEDPDAMLSVRRMREDIYRRFGDVNAQSDAVPFETGPLRPGDMAARDRVRRWQASLRSFYLLEAPLLQFRLFGSTASKSPSFTAFEDDFRLKCSRILLEIAESFESQLSSRVHTGRQTTSLFHHIDALPLRNAAEFSEREQGLARLIRFIAQLVDRLQLEVASEGLYDVLAASEPRQAGYENA
jgi:multidrug resistance protein MdtO